MAAGLDQGARCAGAVPARRGRSGKDSVLAFVLQMTGSNEFKLNQPPEDGISSVKFSPNTSQFLLVSSWDTSVRLYDVPANSMRLKYQHTGAVLDCAFYVGDPASAPVPSDAVLGVASSTSHTVWSIRAAHSYPGMRAL